MLENTCLVARFNKSQWQGTKYDKKVTRRIEELYGASKSGRFTKALVAQDALKEYQSIASEAYVYHCSQTLPWGDNGDRIIPVAFVDRYYEKMNEYKERFVQASSEFIDNYPTLVITARDNLEGMYNPEDYPTQEAMRDKFSFTFGCYPVMTVNDYRVNLGNERLTEMTNNLKETEKRYLGEAKKNLWERMYFPIAKMVERLTKTDSIFRDSLVGNITEVLEVIDGLNIDNDPAVLEMRQRISNMLEGIEPDTLRESRKIRLQIANEGKLVLDNIGTRYGWNTQETIRKIRLQVTGSTQKPVREKTVRNIRTA